MIGWRGTKRARAAVVGLTVAAAVLSAAAPAAGQSTAGRPAAGRSSGPGSPLGHGAPGGDHRDPGAGRCGQHGPRGAEGSTICARRAVP